MVDISLFLQRENLCTMATKEEEEALSSLPVGVATLGEDLEKRKERCFFSSLSGHDKILHHSGEEAKKKKIFPDEVDDLTTIDSPSLSHRHQRLDAGEEEKEMEEESLLMKEKQKKKMEKKKQSILSSTERDKSHDPGEVEEKVEDEEEKPRENFPSSSSSLLDAHISTEQSRYESEIFSRSSSSLPKKSSSFIHFFNDGKEESTTSSSSSSPHHHRDALDDRHLSETVSTCPSSSSSSSSSSDTSSILSGERVLASCFPSPSSLHLLQLEEEEEEREDGEETSLPFTERRRDGEEEEEKKKKIEEEEEEHSKGEREEIRIVNFSKKKIDQRYPKADVTSSTSTSSSSTFSSSLSVSSSSPSLLLSQEVCRHHLIFVYGTLKRGMPNHSIFVRIAREALEKEERERNLLEREERMKEDMVEKKKKREENEEDGDHREEGEQGRNEKDASCKEEGRVILTSSSSSSSSLVSFNPGISVFPGVCCQDDLKKLHRFTHLRKIPKEEEKIKSRDTPLFHPSSSSLFFGFSSLEGSDPPSSSSSSSSVGASQSALGACTTRMQQQRDKRFQESTRTSHHTHTSLAYRSSRSSPIKEEEDQKKEEKSKSFCRGNDVSPSSSLLSPSSSSSLINEIFPSSSSVEKESSAFVLRDCRGSPGGHGRVLSAVYLFDGITKDRYPLFIDSEQRNRPCLLDACGFGENVRGEIYAVSTPVLKALDEFERVPNHYRRRLLHLQVIKETAPEGSLPPSEVFAYVYFNVHSDHMERLKREQPLLYRHVNLADLNKESQEESGRRASEKEEEEKKEKKGEEDEREKREIEESDSSLPRGVSGSERDVSFLRQKTKSEEEKEQEGDREKKMEKKRDDCERRTTSDKSSCQGMVKKKDLSSLSRSVSTPCLRCINNYDFSHAKLYVSRFQKSSSSSPFSSSSSSSSSLSHPHHSSSSPCLLPAAKTIFPVASGENLLNSFG